MRILAYCPYAGIVAHLLLTCCDPSRQHQEQSRRGLGGGDDRRPQLSLRRECLTVMTMRMADQGEDPVGLLLEKYTEARRGDHGAFLLDDLETIPGRRRRQLVVSAVTNALVLFEINAGCAMAAVPPRESGRRDHLQQQWQPQARFLRVIQDPQTYEAVVYVPPPKGLPPSPQSNQHSKPLLPLLVVLHGAGSNDQDAKALMDPMGEHAGLAPSLLATNRAPTELADNFVAVAPYVGDGKHSFYPEPRSKLLQFIQWVLSSESPAALRERIDPNRIFLFGFSDGATVAVELATTRRFRAVAIAAYGFSGTSLPAQALALLQDIPFWVFHSADDVIFPVAYSDRLVQSLQSVSTDRSIVRYTRYDRDQEGFAGSVRGHSTGITASKLPELYNWMLSQT